MNPNCGWCKKADPVVESLNEKGHSITTLDVSKQDDAKRAAEVKAKHNVQCGTPLFIDADSGNAVCGFKEDLLEKWANGEKIPPPPPRPQQQPQMPQQMLDMHKFRLEVWQEARSSLYDNYYGRLQSWTDSIGGDEDRPVPPTIEKIRAEARKIYEFIQKGA